MHSALFTRPHDVIDAITRRRLLAASVVAAGGWTLAGCASVPDPIGDGSGAPAAGPGVVVDFGDSVFDLAVLGVVAAGNIFGPDLLRSPLAGAGVPDDVAQRVMGAPKVSTEDLAIDVEAVLALAPDLILTTELFAGYAGPGLDRVRELGVRVETLPDDVTWQERTRAIGRAVGLAEQAEGRIAGVEGRLAALAADVAAQGRGGATVSLLRAYPGVVSAFVPPSLPSTLLAEVGLTQPDAQLVSAPADSGYTGYNVQIMLSEEVLSAHDADAVTAAVLDVGTGLAGQFPEFAAQAVPALGDGTAVPVPYFLWTLNTAVGAGQVVTDLESVLGRLAG